MIPARLRSTEFFQSHQPVFSRFHNQIPALQNGLYDLQVDVIIFHHQHPLALKSPGFSVTAFCLLRIRLFRNFKGKFHHEGGSLSNFALKPYGTAHKLYQISGNGKTQSAAFKHPSLCGIFLFKGLEQHLLKFFAHTDSIVCHLNPENCLRSVLFCLQSSQGNVPSLSGKLNGIAQKIQKNLL